MYTNRAQQGRDGEAAFARWLNSHKIPYLQIEQERSTLSRGLKELFGAKRPDFVIFVEGLGLILVDVKNEFINEFGEFQIKQSDLLKYSNLEKSFNFKVWFVVSNQQINYREWYWINVKGAQQNSVEKPIYRGTRFIYRSNMIASSKCVKIGNDDDMDVLLSKLRSKR